MDLLVALAELGDAVDDELAECLFALEVRRKDLSQLAKRHGVVAEDQPADREQGVDERADPDQRNAARAIARTALHHVPRAVNAVVDRRGVERAGVVPPALLLGAGALCDVGENDHPEVVQERGVELLECRAPVVALQGDALALGKESPLVRPEPHVEHVQQVQVDGRAAVDLRVLEHILLAPAGHVEPGVGLGLASSDVGRDQHVVVEGRQDVRAHGRESRQQLDVLAGVAG